MSFTGETEMSCCDEPIKPADRKLITAEDILANLPTAVAAPTDYANPLASALRNALPTAGGTKYGRPKIHDDGSVEFEPVPDAAPPAAMEGFSPDPENPWLFRPLWEPCLKRLVGFQKAPSGSLTLRSVCSSPAALGQYMKPVALSACSACPVREGARKNPAKPEPDGV
jgi:hypothetical protein